MGSLNTFYTYFSTNHCKKYCVGVHLEEKIVRLDNFVPDLVGMALAEQKSSGRGRLKSYR